MEKIELDYQDNNGWYNIKQVASYNYKINIIVGIMDSGKSFGAKQLIMDRFEESGEKAIWIMNNGVMLEEEVLKFDIDLKKEDSRWESFRVKKGGTNTWTGEIKVGDEWITLIYFMTITSTVKAARDSSNLSVYYDEFNYGDTRVWNKQTDNFGIILSRNMRNVNQVFLMGNATTLDIPLFHKLKIWEIPDTGFFTHNVFDMECLIHSYTVDKEKINKKYDGSVSFTLMKAFGLVEHAFENEFRNDKFHIKTKEWLQEFKINEEHIIQIGETLYCKLVCYVVNVSKIGFIWNVERYDVIDPSQENIEFSITQKYISDYIYYNYDLKLYLKEMLALGKLFYENVALKENIINLLNK